MDQLYYLLCGVFAGSMAGLFGVGGGLVVVPVLLFVFDRLGMPHDHLTQMAVGTSLAVMFFTCLSSVYSHHQRGAVLWPVVGRLSIGIAFGAVFGAWIDDHISGELVQILLGIFVVIAEARLLLKLTPKPEHQMPGLLPLMLAGFVIGTVSGIFGIGAGIITVPFLIWHQVRMQSAVACAAACAIPAAIFGAGGFIWTGMKYADQLPEWSFGFVYLPALVYIVVASVIFARIGARFAHRFPAERLKRFFAVYLAIVAVRLLSDSV
ncbi:Uncharacterised protein [BD1-7 clade bacterium]|uniref:Probable membrane transporter protein n=1 Tax=BD1-7 clade bacterium TaxID=2029982 RepID=A0A5S9QZ68_9GAMM|nr:Uncharacterised protein [BD1-7 clade bacterium]